MDTCYFSYIFSKKKGYRITFSKDMSIQIIGNALKKYGSKKKILLLRFDNTSEKKIILTIWLPIYYKIVDLTFITWYKLIKSYKNSILITPRGDFKLKEVVNNFFEFCVENYKIM